MKIHPISRVELWSAEVALSFAIILQLIAWAVNPDVTYGPHGLIIGIELALVFLIGLTAGRRHLHRSKLYRTATFALLALISLANVTSFVLVAKLLLTQSQGVTGRELLVAALAILLTNIIIFSLVYWEIDSPGLSGTKWSKNDQDFQFIQQDHIQDYPSWQPSYIDYLYLSVTNAINFAPADTRPITPWAKSLMALQALISVFTLALILARSISILG